MANNIIQFPEPPIHKKWDSQKAGRTLAKNLKATKSPRQIESFLWGLLGNLKADIQIENGEVENILLAQNQTR